MIDNPYYSVKGFKITGFQLYSGITLTVDSDIDTNIFLTVFDVTGRILVFEPDIHLLEGSNTVIINSPIKKNGIIYLNVRNTKFENVISLTMVD